MSRLIALVKIFLFAFCAAVGFILCISEPWQLSLLGVAIMLAGGLGIIGTIDEI